MGMIETSRRAMTRLTAAARRFRGASEGMAAIEMAFIFPVMLIVYFGMIDVTNLLAAKRRITLASSTIADLVTQSPGAVTPGDVDGFFQAVSPIMEPFPSNTVGIKVFTYQVVNNSVTLRWSRANGGVSCGSAPATTGFAALMASGNDLVVAQTCIDMLPITGNVIANTNYQLAKETVLRPRQSLTIVCNPAAC